MLIPAEFVAAWKSDDVPLVRFGPTALEHLAVSDEDREFLAKTGLPEDAAPFLSFESPKSGPIPTVADRWRQSKEFARYRVIGSDGEGSPLAIDEAAGGEVVHLDHDNRFARVLMNKSIRQLAESLLAYRKLVEDTVATNGPDAFLDWQIPKKARDELEARLNRIDPAAMQPGCYWQKAVAAIDGNGV